MRWKDKTNIKLNILIVVTYKKNQMNVLEITKYSIWNKELIGGFSCRINTTKYRTSKFEEIPKQRSMYVRHKEQRKTTTKKQKPKGKKKTQKWAKRNLGTLLTSLMYVSLARASKAALVVKDLPANAGDVRDSGSIPRSGSSPGEGNGNYSGMLAWRIPWTEERGGLQCTGSWRVGHNWVCMCVHIHTHTHRQTRQTKRRWFLFGEQRAVVPSCRYIPKTVCLHI